MLKPSSDRLDYGQLLTPPDGFTLSHAIGTTFSLDFDTLIGATLALELSVETDSSLLQDPLYLLSSLRQAGDRITILCQAGQIHLPRTPSPLYILLEKIVYQVQIKRRRQSLPSFHPKVWLIKYVNDANKILYRLIVMSRNLTFDRSWDIAVSLEGQWTKQPSDENESIISFVKYLRDQIPSNTANGRSKRIRFKEMIDDLANIQFETNSKEFSDFEFLPVGIPQEDGKRLSIEDTPIYAKPFQELLIMSPFISRGTIESFNRRSNHHKNSRCMLITRKDALTCLNNDQTDRFEFYTMKDQVVDGELMISENQEHQQQQDIHAKMYLWNRYGESELYLGSMNATHSAMNGNVEAMLRLISKNRWLNLDQLTKDLFGGEPDNPDNPFERTYLNNVAEVEEDIVTQLERKIRQVIQYPAKAKIQPTSDTYQAIITFDKRIPENDLWLSPLLVQDKQPLTDKIIFSEMNLLSLSEFYVVTAETEGVQINRIIKIVTINLPEHRENEVVTSIIQDTPRFFQYLAFILGDNYLLSALELSLLKKGKQFYTNPQAMIPALYERLLKTAARSPEKFSDIEYLINMINDQDIIPKDFLELYQSFRKAVGLK